MAKAKKLPSGSWRVLVYDYTDEHGKRIYRSFTSDTPGPSGKREAEYLAAEFAIQKKDKKSNSKLLFGDALDKYIDSRKNVLSPRSIANYRRMRKTDLDSLSTLDIYQLTQDDIQNFVNKDCEIHSPKTVRDNHGLISAVLGEFRPDFRLTTKLPKLKRPTLYVPSDNDIQRLITAAAGTKLELPILLAAFGPMRRGEICALDSKYISGNTVHVCSNMVLNENRQWIIKEPKTYAGDRFINYPDFVAELFKNIDGPITSLNPDALSCRFRRFLKSHGIVHFRFHDLRHYCASIQHALGIPDAYIMERSGWSNDAVLKNIYRHTMDDKKKAMDNTANDYFDKLCNTNCNTKKESP